MSLRSIIGAGVLDRCDRAKQTPPGVSYTTVRRYAMQPMTKVDIDSVSRIRETFGCSWEELLELLGDGSFEE